MRRTWRIEASSQRIATTESDITSGVHPLIPISSRCSPSEAAATSITVENCSTRSLTGSRISPGASTTPSPAGWIATSVPCATEITPFRPRATANAISARLSPASTWASAWTSRPCHHDPITSTVTTTTRTSNPRVFGMRPNLAQLG